MLEGVVSHDGTAPEAQIPGYRVAGKTGTADATTRRRLLQRAHRALHRVSPRPTTRSSSSAVTLQRPVYRYFGGYVAGPVFKDVMTYALQELKIPPTGTKPPKVTEAHAQGGAGRPHRPAQRHKRSAR